MRDCGWTPGPWAHAVRNNHEIQCSFVGVVIGGEYMDVGFVNDMADHANAHLIAAAPDMYEALEQALTSMQDGGYQNDHVAIRAGREAMAKARGES